jgi:hypothetical protein
VGVAAAVVAQAVHKHQRGHGRASRLPVLRVAGGSAQARDVSVTPREATPQPKQRTPRHAAPRPHAVRRVARREPAGRERSAAQRHTRAAQRSGTARARGRHRVAGAPQRIASVRWAHRTRIWWARPWLGTADALCRVAPPARRPVLAVRLRYSRQQPAALRAPSAPARAAPCARRARAPPLRRLAGGTAARRCSHVRGPHVVPRLVRRMRRVRRGGASPAAQSAQAQPLQPFWWAFSAQP